MNQDVLECEAGRCDEMEGWMTCLEGNGASGRATQSIIKKIEVMIYTYE